MTKNEEIAIRNVIKRLKCEKHPNGQDRESDSVREALRGPAALYLDTWVIPALEMLLPESRNPELAAKLSG